MIKEKGENKILYLQSNNMKYCSIVTEEEQSSSSVNNNIRVIYYFLCLEKIILSFLSETVPKTV